MMFLQPNSRTDPARREFSSRPVMMTKTSSEETREKQVQVVKEASRLAAPTTASSLKANSKRRSRVVKSRRSEPSSQAPCSKPAKSM